MLRPAPHSLSRKKSIKKGDNHMKKEIIKKMLASAMGLMLITSMNAVAFAAELSSGVSVTNENSVNISKTLTVSNPNLTKVDGPGMSYSYSINTVEPSADNGGVSVTDSENNTGTVHAGPSGGVSLTASGVTFPVGTALNASPTGAENKKFFTAATDISKFTAPGIYRYQIRETLAPQDPASVGVTDTGDRDRYLDVYIENSDSGLKVAGYTLHDKYNNKTDGFNGGSTGAGQPFTGMAAFETKNIVLETEVTGNMGDRNHQFPFEGVIKDNGRSFYAKKGEAPVAASDEVAGSAAGTRVSTTLSHTEKYYISGLSSAALVNYTETNNTPDTYSISITGGNDSNPTKVAPNGEKTMGEASVIDSARVVFTNNLETVSPTGVVLRFGYAVFLIAAGAALVILRRNSGTEKR